MNQIESPLRSTDSLLTFSYGKLILFWSSGHFMIWSLFIQFRLFGQALFDSYGGFVTFPPLRFHLLLHFTLQVFQFL